MSARKKNRDDAPTRPQDWVTAALVRPGDRPRKEGKPVTFFVYRASTDSALFAAIPRNDANLLPPCPKGRWQRFKTFQETGQPRIGFDEKKAKSDFAAKGFHLLRVRIDTSDIPAKKIA